MWWHLRAVRLYQYKFSPCCFVPECDFSGPFLHTLFSRRVHHEELSCLSLWWYSPCRRWSKCLGMGSAQFNWFTKIFFSICVHRSSGTFIIFNLFQPLENRLRHSNTFTREMTLSPNIDLTRNLTLMHCSTFNLKLNRKL